MKRIILTALLFFILGGCATWQNPDLVDQSKRDEYLQRDKEYCNKVAAAEVPIGAGTDDEALEPTTYEAEFSENYTSANAFERCMNDRGWTKE